MINLANRKNAPASAVREGRFSFAAILSGLFLAAFALFILDITVGPVHIPIKDILKVVGGMEIDSTGITNIIEKIRIPKAIAAVLVGAALAASGLLMQTLFRNPLAGPDVLGITSGASLGVSLVMLAGGAIPTVQAIKQTGALGGWIIVVAASMGSALVLLVVLAISAKVKDNASLMIIGIMAGALTISLVSLMLYLASPEQIQDYLMWTFGTIGGVSGKHLWTLGSVVAGGLGLALAASKPLNILLIGENYARSLGLSVFRSRILIIAATCLLSGSVTAFCGPIGFIGLAVPHLCRALLHTSDHLRLILAACVMGSIVVLACDIVTQLPGSRSLMPLNVMTSIVGAPVVIWVIARVKHRKSPF
ncbi:MAG: iron ABC transporter permease [Fibrobacteres bacterium]|nr:iron ABC transporter permease [Fibrobacterota bacterium]